MYNEKIEDLIKAALADGQLTEKEKQILFRRAEAEGLDLDEFEMVLDARLVELQKEEMELSQKAAPKSDKFGDVRKCPACGAIISSGIALCKECGYAFTGIDAIASREKLYNALMVVDNDKIENTPTQSVTSWLESTQEKQHVISKQKATKKGTIITSFPVPNTKADLIDFLSFLMALANPKARRDYMSSGLITASEDLGFAYWVLFENCITKARISFSKDSDFEIFYQKYNELKNTSSSSSKGFFSNLFGDLFGR